MRKCRHINYCRSGSHTPKHRGTLNDKH